MKDLPLSRHFTHGTSLHNSRCRGDSFFRWLGGFCERESEERTWIKGLGRESKEVRKAGSVCKWDF